MTLSPGEKWTFKDRQNVPGLIYCVKFWDKNVYFFSIYPMIACSKSIKVGLGIKDELFVFHLCTFSRFSTVAICVNRANLSLMVH